MDDHVLPLATGFVAAILAMAGTLKLTGTKGSGDLLAVVGLSWPPSRLVDRALPVAELTLATLLLSSLVPVAASLLTAAFFLVSSTVLLTAKIRGYGSKCGCFGDAIDGSLPSAILRNGLPLLAAGGSTYLNSVGQSASVAGSVSWTAAGLLSGVTYILGWALIEATIRFHHQTRRAHASGVQMHDVRSSSVRLIGIEEVQ